MNVRQHTYLRAHVITLMSAALFGILLTACKGKEELPTPPENPANPTTPTTPTTPETTDEDVSAYDAIVEMTADVVLGNEYAKGPARVHLGPDNTSDHSKVTEIRWSLGDEVACWNAEEKRWAPYVLTDGANTTTARFQGKAVHKDDNVQGQEALNISHSIFPLSATVRQLTTHDGQDSLLISPGHMVHSIYFTMPGVQTYHEPRPNGDGGYDPTFGTQYNVMTGTRSPSNPGHILFRSTGGVLLLRIKGSSFLNSLYGLKLTSRNLDEKLWGTFTAAIGTGGESTVEVAMDINGTPLDDLKLPEGNNTLILDCHADYGAEDKLPKDKFTNFYFVLPYGVLSSGFTITMDTDGDGDYDDGTITTTKNNTIIQSDIKVMPALELTENINLTWDLDDMYSQGTVTEF